MSSDYVIKKGLQKFVIIVSICLGFLSPLAASEAFTITLNEDEQYAIREILISMGEKNWAKLLFESRRLSSLGNSIQHVEPLQFLGYILSDPRLKECLRKSHKNYFKWIAFMDGLRPKMEREWNDGTLQPKIFDFAVFVEGDPVVLENLSEKHAWDEFVKCLL